MKLNHSNMHPLLHKNNLLFILSLNLNYPLSPLHVKSGFIYFPLNNNGNEDNNIILFKVKT